MAAMVADANLAEDAGVGSARVFEDGGHGLVYDHSIPFNAEVDGVDVFVGQDAIQAYLPGFVSSEVEAMMHVKRSVGTHCVQQPPAQFSVLAQSAKGGQNEGWGQHV